jgi:hypothetical protein
MPNNPSSASEEVSSGADFIITADPGRFDMQRVYDTLLIIVKRIQRGLPVGGDDVCPCSIFPLEDLAHLALKGELFADMPIKNVAPETVAGRLAFYLFGEVVRIHTAQVMADKQSDDD